jgi:hypothetical protein
LSSWISSEITSVVQKRADERQWIADERIASSERATAEALAGAARANARIAETENARRVLEIELEKERQERIRLQMHLTSRRITPEQRNKMADVLRGNPGTVVIQSMHDGEAGLFAGDMLKVFTDAGWHIDGIELPLGETWFGLILYRSPDPDFSTIFAALQNAGIEFAIANKPPAARATVLVGSKPPLF